MRTKHCCNAVMNGLQERVIIWLSSKALEHTENPRPSFLSETAQSYQNSTAFSTYIFKSIKQQTPTKSTDTFQHWKQDSTHIDVLHVMNTHRTHLNGICLVDSPKQTSTSPDTCNYRHKNPQNIAQESHTCLPSSNNYITKFHQILI